LLNQCTSSTPENDPQLRAEVGFLVKVNQMVHALYSKNIIHYMTLTQCLHAMLAVDM